MMRRPPDIRELPLHSRGFTLIELIAVLVIVGVVSAVLASKLPSSSLYTLQSRAEVIKSHLRYAQTRAMSSGAVCGIYFPDGASYALFRNGNTSDRVTLSGESSTVVSLPSGMSVTDSAGTRIVSFDSWGRPHTDASATSAAASRTLTVSFEGSIAPIQITQNTGFIP